MKKLATSAAIAIGLATLSLPAAYAAGSQNHHVRCVTRTLPADGTNVPVRLIALADTFIGEIMVDNTPSKTAGLCGFVAGDPENGTPDTCTESDHRVVRKILGSSDMNPGQNPENLADSDKLAVRPILDQQLSIDTVIPVRSGQSYTLWFDTDNGVNDVRIEICFGAFSATAPSVF